MKEVNKTSSRRIIKTFAAASFLNDMGSDIIYPIWPLFVTSVLKANMAALGFLDGLGDALVSLSQAGSGFLSDKLRKRKFFIWIGYLLGALSRIGYALSSVWTHLIPFRALDRTGKIRSAPRDALVADVSSVGNRGKNFGLLRTMDNLGAVAGIIICIIFFRLLGYRLLFALAAIPSLASALLVLFFIKEKKEGKLKIYKGISFKEISSDFKIFLILSSIYALAAFSYSFLLVYARNFGFKTAFVPVLYLIFTASASLLSYPFGKLSDNIGRKSVIFIAFFLWATVCFSFIFSRSYLLIIIAFFLYGAHKGALEPVQKTFVCELSPQKYRASGLGGFQMITGLFALPASFLAGLLWEVFGPLAPFYFSLSLTLISGLMLFLVKEKQNNI